MEISQDFSWESDCTVKDARMSNWGHERMCVQEHHLELEIEGQVDRIDMEILEEVFKLCFVSGG